MAELRTRGVGAGAASKQGSPYAVVVVGGELPLLQEEVARELGLAIGAHGDREVVRRPVRVELVQAQRTQHPARVSNADAHENMSV